MRKLRYMHLVAEKDRTASSLQPRFMSEAAQRYLSFALLLLIVLLFALIRYRLRNTPLERDEGEYAYAGQLLLQGIPPYQFAYTMKLPGIAAAYAITLAAFGQTGAGVHLGLLVVNAVTIVLVFFLGRRLFGWLAAVVAAATYALLSTSHMVLGIVAHATHFVLLPALAGILLLLKAIEEGKTWMYYCSGLLLGLGVTMKQPGIAFVFFAGLYLVGSQWTSPTARKRLPWTLAALGLGSATPLAIILVVMWKAGVFAKFWLWTFSYASQYTSSMSLSNGLLQLRYALPVVIGSALLLWLLAAIGFTAVLWNAMARSRALFLIAFPLFSFMAVTPGLYFRRHYFVLLLPAVALLAGVAVSAATKNLCTRGRSRMLQAAPAAMFALIFALSLFWARDFYLMPADDLRSYLSLTEPFRDAPEISAYVREHTSPSDTVAVFGSEPDFYFYSRRHSATGYIYMYPMMENQIYAAGMQQEMIQQIERARPKVAIMVHVGDSWLKEPDSDRTLLAFTQNYLETQYKMVGVADIAQPTTFVWGDAAPNYHPTSLYYVSVYQRVMP
jgi:hypothetical protein